MKHLSDEHDWQTELCPQSMCNTYISDLLHFKHGWLYSLFTYSLTSSFFFITFAFLPYLLASIFYNFYNVFLLFSFSFQSK